MIKNFSPIILSASRATDIPAFYGDWFIDCLKKGFFIKKNPFNGELYKIRTNETRAIVFWTKNPENFFQYLTEVNKIIPNYYFQFTLNNYDQEIESNIPRFYKRTEVFIKLSELIGKEKVIWRFDPLLLSDKLDPKGLIENIYETANLLKDYTEKLVFSFIDIEKYGKVRNKLSKARIKIREFNEDEKFEIADALSSVSSEFNIEVASCAEESDLSSFGIHKNKCIDDQLLKRLFPEDTQLMSFLNDRKNLKDKGQRKECGCIKSKDIGKYNTCLHSCVYCYAVTSHEAALKNSYIQHANNT